ncbi:vWA domain-containing protein [Calidithermus chliarophilus]|uniref:vWA domain-containing protein n=1 Tax=Calidithermus chliarophilus TaxID=52023 RepID=UPI0004215746|nr:VWA domain-containing protein [Calidithermus chliarophilus]
MTPSLPSGHLLAHVVRFTRLLREGGVVVTPGQTMTFVRALEQISLLDAGSFYYAARTSLLTRREDYDRFHALFVRFWREFDSENSLSELFKDALGLLPAKPRPRPLEVASVPRSGEAQSDKPPVPLVDRSLTYSTDETLKQRSFEAMSAEEIEVARRLLQDFDWRISERPTRRLQPAGSGALLDLRRSFRKALKHQGEFVRLAWQGRKTKPRPLVVLADVSGSMERYARMLLHFLHAFAQAQNRQGVRTVEAFAFGTRLTRITRPMKKRSVDAALLEVGRLVKDWSGGTRIGGSLREFNRTWAKRVLGRGAVVLLISDGWDQGDPELLAFEIERLQKSCHRLIWLNPLLGTPGYQPLTRGLVAALPFVDDFLPVHNLYSLEQLARALESLPERGGPRRSGLAKAPA